MLYPAELWVHNSILLFVLEIYIVFFERFNPSRKDPIEENEYKNDDGCSYEWQNNCVPFNLRLRHVNSYAKTKASEEIRTLDLLDGNQMLYQLSYTRKVTTMF